MNKKEFLNSLQKKLSILDEQEVKDIINEYEDIIDQKVKDGKTELEAVKEFGSIDELSSEILKTYKLNSKYTKENEPLKDTVDNIEDGIKKMSHSLANFFKSLNNGNGLSVELIFELIIKFLILLVILAVLRLPFELLIGIGEGIFGIAYYPVDKILGGFWHIGITALYFVACALIFIALFKQYVSNDTVKNNKVKEEKTVNKNKEIKQETKKKETKVKDNSKESPLLSIIEGLCKVFMVLVFIIPLWCVNFGLVTALGVVSYFTIIGINIWGLIILLIGLILGFSWITSFFHSITFKTKRITVILLPISLLLTVVGSLAFASNILTFDYIDENRKFNNIVYDKIEKESEIEGNITISYFYGSDLEYNVNNEIENNKMKIEVVYPKDLMTIDNIFITRRYDDNSVYQIHTEDYSNGLTAFKKVYKTVISDLKKGKLYNYNPEAYISVIVSANEETMKLIK